MRKKQKQICFRHKGLREKADIEKGRKTSCMPGALGHVTEGFRNPFFCPCAFSAGVMHNGFRPLRALDISLVLLSSGGLGGWGKVMVEVCCPVPWSPQVCVPSGWQCGGGLGTGGGGQDSETGSSRDLLSACHLKASCRKYALQSVD